MPYGVSARDYLERAKQRLSEGTLEGMFYAALELRSGVEARLQEYLEPHEHIAANRRTDWKVKNLHRTAEEAFQLGDQVARIAILDMKTRKVIATFYYTPVQERLKSLAERFGDYLHAARRRRDDSDPFWVQLRAELTEAAGLLEEATTGTLLGPMLLGGDSGETVMPLELPPDERGTAAAAAKNLIGVDLILDVSYHPTLAAARSQKPRPKRG